MTHINITDAILRAVDYDGHKLKRLISIGGFLSEAACRQQRTLSTEDIHLLHSVTNSLAVEASLADVGFVVEPPIAEEQFSHDSYSHQRDLEKR